MVLGKEALEGVTKHVQIKQGGENEEEKKQQLFNVYQIEYLRPKCNKTQLASVAFNAIKHS